MNQALKPIKIGKRGRGRPPKVATIKIPVGKIKQGKVKQQEAPVLEAEMSKAGNGFGRKVKV